MTRNINSVKRGQLEQNLISVKYFTTLTHCYDEENSNKVCDLLYTERIVYQGCRVSSFVYIAMCLKILCVDSKGLCVTGYHKQRNLVIFRWDKQYYCLIMKENAEWLVGYQ